MDDLRPDAGWSAIPPSSRVAVVIDAAIPVGRAAALALADRGWCVLACGPTREGLHDMSRETMAGGLVEIMIAPSPAEALDRAAALFGRVDALVCAAMDARFGAAEETADETARAVFETNVFAPLNALRAAASRFRAARRGRIVCLSSAAGRVALPMSALTSASHHALEGLCGALRLELRSFGVHVVLVASGFVRREDSDPSRDALADAVSSLAPDSPYAPVARAVAEAARELLEEAATPSDVADIVVRALEDERPKPRYTVRRKTAAWLFARKVLPERMLERRIAKALGLDEVDIEA